MAKPTEKPIADETAFPEATRELLLKFLDTVYTSRTLILPDQRELLVFKATVTVSASDAVALKYLKENAEFEQLKE
ncbi:hypothetical protein C4K35_2101 [Pseudomonas chlororaphis subsp. piscium]|uniref:hypothetical protein n=1 Tax=Pseudomonas chlororaphis TaxID=587753 RepID=UPI000F564399|nr:hypothetical protein [Pseudomonas chlororaphis]AZC49694.1 hypothetical protein C4K35_2101 [Pseudomonas chlororaphis subsp. piscium]